MKKILIFFMILIICGGIVVIVKNDLKKELTVERLPILYDNISLDEETGVVYDNTELIVICSVPDSSDYMLEAAKQYEFRILEHISNANIYLIRFNKTFESVEELKETAERLKNLDYIDDAFWNTVFIEEADMIPNDPWGTERGDYETVSWSTIPDGQNWGLEAINVMKAWESLNVMENVKVGIIDYAPQLQHEDLHISSELIASYADGTIERYCLENENIDYINMDPHGTFVAGIIGAEWNNGIGVSGVTANKAELFHSMTVELNETNEGRDYNTAFSYFMSLSSLLDKGVQVINISQNTDRLKCFAASRGNEAAITYLEENAKALERMLKQYINETGRNDFVICVAAGNNNDIGYVKDKKSIYGYKKAENVWFWEKIDRGNVEAKYNNFISLIDDEDVSSKIIVVGSIGYDEGYYYSTFSNIGDRVDLVAPGENVYSLTVDGYDIDAGTSYATPYVSGAAALLFALNPDFSGEDVKRILLDTCNYSYEYSGVECGLLDVAEAVEKGKEIYADALLQEYKEMVLESAPGEEIINSVYADMDNNGIPEGYFITVNGNEAEEAKKYMKKGYGMTSDVKGRLWICYKEECNVVSSIVDFFNLDYFVLKNGVQILINSCHGGNGWYNSAVYMNIDGELQIVEWLPNGDVDEDGNLIFTDDIPNFFGQATYLGEIIDGKVEVIKIIDEGYYDEQAANWRSE